MRAAIYSRFSSNLQSDASIEDQVRQCRRRIEQEGWSLTKVYSDAAISGATTQRHYDHARMIGAVRRSNEVITALRDRFRDEEDLHG